MNIEFTIQRNGSKEEMWNYTDVVLAGIMGEASRTKKFLTLKSESDKKLIYIPLDWIKNIQVNPL